MLTGLIGNGLAVLVAGVALLAARFRHHLPGGQIASELVLTAAVVAMLFAGELARSTGVGHWVTQMTGDAEGWLGSSGRTAAALIAFAMLLGVAVAVVRTATERAMMLAFALPFALALFGAGFFHNLDTALQAPAQAVAVRLAAGLGV